LFASEGKFFTVQEKALARAEIEALVCGYSGTIRQRKQLVMLTAYFDDSSSEQEEKLLVLAGYIHNAETWARFSDDWQVVLAAPPSIEYFKMREAENLNGQFGGWEPIARNAKVLTFAEVIEKHVPWSIECSISRRNHQAIVRPVGPYDLRFPYFDAFYAVIIKLAQWHYQIGLTIPVDFVFDEQGEIGAEAVIWYEHIKSIQPPEISALLGSTPVFRDDKKILPLQAADLLAWHIRRGKEPRNTDEYRPVVEKLYPLLHASVPLGEEYLRKIAKEMSELPHIGLRQEKKDSVKGLLRELLGRGKREKDKNGT
jgi:hypothetical protein